MTSSSSDSSLVPPSWFRLENDDLDDVGILALLNGMQPYVFSDGGNAIRVSQRRQPGSKRDHQMVRFTVPITIDLIAFVNSLVYITIYPSRQRFEKLKWLGSGASGDVWLVREVFDESSGGGGDGGDGPLYALKEVSNFDFSRDVVHELEALKYIKERYSGCRDTASDSLLSRILICLYASGTGITLNDRGSKITYIVTDYVEGIELFDWVENPAQRPWQWWWQVMLQILVPIQMMHNELKMAHRDIKLENFIVRPNGTVVLVDYGFSCAFEKCGELPFQVGTLLYSSPEIKSRQATRESTADKAAIDVYAAVTCLEFIVDGASKQDRATPEIREIYVKFFNLLGEIKEAPLIQRPNITEMIKLVKSAHLARRSAGETGAGAAVKEPTSSSSSKVAAEEEEGLKTLATAAVAASASASSPSSHGKVRRREESQSQSSQSIRRTGGSGDYDYPLGSQDFQKW